MHSFFYSCLRVVMLCFCAVTTSMACAQHTWQQPSFFQALIENNPDCFRRVYYYFDPANSTEYNRIQFSADKSKLSARELQNIRLFYDHLYSTVADEIKNGKHHSLSQFISADSVSYTIDANTSGMLDIGPSGIQIDLGSRNSATPAAKVPDFKSLESKINAIVSRPGVSSAKVRYTGFKPGYVFVFHRGSGKGWTTGTRYTIKNASRSDFEAVRSAINSFIGTKVPVTVFDRTWLAMVKNETGPQFYAVGFDPRSRTLNILKASVEKEICIPELWQTIDYID